MTKGEYRSIVGKNAISRDAGKKKDAPFQASQPELLSLSIVRCAPDLLPIFILRKEEEVRTRV